MNDENVEVVITGGVGTLTANAADHVALALMGAGATMDFPGRPNQGVRPAQTLRGVHAVVRMAEGAGLAVLPGSSRGGGNLPAVVKLAIGVVLLLVLCSVEVRLHFGLQLDTIITVEAIAGCWRWCLCGSKTIR